MVGDIGAGYRLGSAMISANLRLPGGCHEITPTNFCLVVELHAMRGIRDGRAGISTGSAGGDRFRGAWRRQRFGVEDLRSRQDGKTPAAGAWRGMASRIHTPGPGKA